MGGAREGGGSFALAELIDKHGSALLSDFQAYYQLELGQVVLDRSPDYVLALIEGLPDNLAFAAAMRGGRQFRGWGQDRNMLADLWDLTAAVGMAGSKKKPPKFPRPQANRPTWRTLMQMGRRRPDRG